MGKLIVFDLGSSCHGGLQEAMDKAMKGILASGPDGGLEDSLRMAVFMVTLNAGTVLRNALQDAGRGAAWERS